MANYTYSDDTTYYFYDSEDIIIEWNVTYVLQRYYTHGPGIDDPVSVRINGESFYYIKDYLGNVILIINIGEEFEQYYTYDAWGTIVAQTG